MTHLGTKQLKTPRLILRPLTVADAPAMYKNWASDSEVTRYLRWLPHADVSVTYEYLAFVEQEYSDPAVYQWAIVPKDLGEPIGTISVVGRDETVESVIIGYCIGKDWWGRGITAEALRELLRFFFEEVGVNRIELKHDVNNPNSGKVMEKCGMRYEGTRRQAARNNQGVVDVAQYAILKEDWSNLK